MAGGAAGELQYHLMLAHDLGFLSGSDYNQLDQKNLGSEVNADDSVKSLFPLSWWEGIKGRGKITKGKYEVYSPPP
jgi:hypothetical protein